MWFAFMCVNDWLLEKFIYQTIDVTYFLNFYRTLWAPNWWAPNWWAPNWISPNWRTLNWRTLNRRTLNWKRNHSFAPGWSHLSKYDSEMKGSTFIYSLSSLYRYKQSRFTAWNVKGGSYRTFFIDFLLSKRIQTQLILLNTRWRIVISI